MQALKRLGRRTAFLWLLLALVTSFLPTATLHAQDERSRERDTRERRDSERKSSENEKLNRDSDKLRPNEEKLSRNGDKVTESNERLARDGDLKGKEPDKLSRSEDRLANDEKVKESDETKRARLEQLRESQNAKRQQAKVDEIKLQSPSERERALGMDPATKEFRANEGKVGAEIEAKYGYFERSKSPGAEWVSVSGRYEGKTFDLTGPPKEAREYQDPNMNSFLKNFDKDLNKADYTVLETREMTAEQRAKVLEHVNAKDNKMRERIIVLE